MTEPKMLVCWSRFALVTGFVAGLVAGLTLASVPAYAQSGSVRDESSTLTQKGNQVTKAWWQERFAGSTAELTNYFGSGTFYTSGYHDPYVSTALYLKPVFKLGTKRELSIYGRLYLEVEYTKVDNPEARRENLLDSWLVLNAKNLYTEARSKIRVGGLFRAILPTSYESRYQHLVVGLTAGLNANRSFEFGQPDPTGKKWNLALTLSSSFTKFIQTSKYRGAFAGDTTGCRSQQTAVSGGLVGGGGADGATASASDHCGGPLNPNFSFTSAANATLSRRRFSLSMTMIVINQFQYAVPDDAFSATYGVSRGRSDVTWGLISLGYDITDHFGVSVGLSSYQPAMDSTYSHPRFPFFDFSGPNANNYTQAFVGVSGTI